MRVNLRIGEDDVAHETIERLGADTAADRICLPDQEIDAGDPVLDGDELLVLRIVGHSIRLNESGRPIGQDDQIEVGGIASFDRRQVMLDNLFVCLSIRPPAADVLALEPLVEERQVGRRQRAKLDLHSKSADTSSASALDKGCSSASSAGSRCVGRRGPTTTAVTHGWANNQEIARVAESTPRRVAISASRSSAVNVSGLRRCSYGPGRIDIREPSGAGSSRLYFPVSQPPASGPYGVYAIPSS